MFDQEVSVVVPKRSACVVHGKRNAQHIVHQQLAAHARNRLTHVIISYHVEAKRQPVPSTRADYGGAYRSPRDWYEQASRAVGFSQRIKFTGFPADVPPPVPYQAAYPPYPAAGYPPVGLAAATLPGQQPGGYAPLPSHPQAPPVIVMQPHSSPDGWSNCLWYLCCAAVAYKVCDCLTCGACSFGLGGHHHHHGCCCCGCCR